MSDRVERRMKESGVPPRFVHAEFSRCVYAPDSEPDDIERFNRIKSFFEKWSQDPEGMAFVHGPTGTGKTFLAACALRRYIGFHLSAGPAPLYTRFDLLDQIRDSVARDKAGSFVRRIAEAQGLLVIDDLGVGRVDGWPGEQLCRIIYNRYDAELPTLITSNHDLRWIAINLDARIADRIAESRQVFPYVGKNRRLAPG